MADETDYDASTLVRKRRRIPRLVFGAVFLLLFLLLATAYWQRMDLADNLLRDAIKDLGIDARFEIKDVGLRTQRLENVVIGDPKSPDLQADWVEVDVAINFSGVTPREVRASGVRLNGKYIDGKLSFGQLDTCTDPDSKEPFDLPDIAMDLNNAQVRLDTPWGVIGAGLDGSGLLRQGFEGLLAVRAPTFNFQDCLAQNVRFDGRYMLDFRQPNLIGPISFDKLKCKQSGFAAARLVVDADARLSERFDNWLGEADYSADIIQSSEVRFGNPKGVLKFDGNKQRTNFETQIKSASFASRSLDARNVTASAKGKLGFATSGLEVSARGDVAVQGGTLDDRHLVALDNVTAQASKSPVGPLLARIRPQLRSAIAKFDALARYDASVETDGHVNVLIDRFALISRSGTKLTQSGPAELNGFKGMWSLSSPVKLALAGGGLPAANVSLSQGRGTVWSGSLQLQQYTADGASLAIPDLAFSGTPNGAWKFTGRALVTGPLPEGFITALNVPIDARWDGRNLSLYQSCQILAFQGVRYSNFVLSGQSIRLCPNGGGSILQAGSGGTRFNTAVPDFAMAGSLGGEKLTLKGSDVRFNLDQGFNANNVFAEYGNSPIRVKAPALRFSFADGFKSNNVKVEIGRGDVISEFAIASIFGRPAKGGFVGRLDDANGHIANVPLILDEAAGDWTFRGGNLTLSGALRVSDQEQVDRFQPMNVPDALVTLENGIINALGNLHEPKTGRQVAQVDIRHALAQGAGGALLSIDQLRFDEGFQPELLTPLTLGVIANARGSVSGDGRIDWNANGVKSGGRFVTEPMNVAAAFGPVENLQTEIVFSDLLGFETGPGQLAKIGSVNPGIAAIDGKIRYQLLPGKKVGIEGGTWPFAGGELILEPTVLDFGIDKDRRLTFRVVGMDAAQFLQQYDFQNLQVSGVFDGTLPMVFNQEGGRIIGGSLVSRPGGGQVSYVGELTYKDMGVFANYAFNALKSIRYNELVIGIAGDIDGEIVTEVKFAGLQQGTGASRNFITKQLAKIPIQFNVTVRAQFMQLISSVRGLYDAEYARDQGLPFLLDRKAGVPPITGEEESEPKDE
jgi:translocation and assembly module TamB